MLGRCTVAMVMARWLGQCACCRLPMREGEEGKGERETSLPAGDPLWLSLRREGEPEDVMEHHFPVHHVHVNQSIHTM